MPRIILCSRTNDKLRTAPDGMEDPTKIENQCARINTHMAQLINRRERGIAKAIHKVGTWSDKMNALLATFGGNRHDPIEDPSQCNDAENQQTLASLKPLEEMILVIVWELCNCKFSETLIEPWVDSKTGALDNFVLLLSSAASYEVISNNRVV